MSLVCWLFLMNMQQLCSKILTLSWLEEGFALGMAPVMSSATDNRYFFTFISWQYLFWFCAHQDVSPLYLVTVGAMTGQPRKQQECRMFPLRMGHLNMYRERTSSTALPSTHTPGAFLVWRLNPSQTKLCLEKIK